MSTIEYAFFPVVFFAIGFGFWLGIKVSEWRNLPSEPSIYTNIDPND